ncbi:dynein heavy chain 5, axonemal-like [Anneissia japonica]|uniref:dynein heavy chain 5, axonemal-like n=1 Tax=Anneissia japonica TaxID=1529436 RepID=UPI0014259B00|nr:dynein heavy chain 5, axonemal-like [Anneissia japonica]
MEDGEGKGEAAPQPSQSEAGPVSEKEANKPDSPKPDQDIGPPLISVAKPEKKEEKDEVVSKEKKKPTGGAGQHRRGPPAPSVTKKNVVMSSEAMKEMAKQAKANRDERRTMMDARHQYLFSKLAEATNLEVTQIEDFLLGDERFDLIGDFFAADGSRKLMFFHQEAGGRETLHSRTADTASIATIPQLKRVFITTGTSEGINGICYFFLRTTNKAITVANITQEVTFTFIDCNGGKILDGFSTLFSRVLVPCLKSQESWGELTNNSQMSEFLEQLERFVGMLSGAKANMDGHIQLAEHEYLESMLDTLKSPADFQAAASIPDTVDKLEALILLWARQIEQVLTESEQMRKEADDIGPTAELDHWKQRMAKFNSLLEQIKSAHCKAVVGVLHVAKSKALKHWKELDCRITDAANEAKDNVKYLYTLDKFFGPLVKCDPTTMVEHIPSLMNAIRMIHSISRYYNTSERMTSLFVKVTNQMINTCKGYINQGVSRIWDHERPELLKRLNACIYLNEMYQQCFHRTKDKLKETPEERQFEFSENYIFGKFDTFCKRLERIADMVNTIENLSGLADVRVEGIESIFIRFQGIVATYKKKGYDVLDHRKGDFDIDYLEFRVQIESVYTHLQNFLDSWFDRSLTTEKALDLLSKFERINASDHLNLNEKYMRVLSSYGRDLESVRKLYQKGKDEPTIPRNVPPVAGKITWARQLYRRVDLPMKAFKKKPDILRTSEAKRIIRNFNKMAAVLLEYELLYHRGWFRAVDAVKSGLQSSLLIRHPETKQLFVNFDPQVLELIAETKHLVKMNLEVPEAAYELVMREEEIKAHFNMLTDVIKEYEGTKAQIPAVLQPLMHPYCKRIEDALEPGLTRLNWTSLSIDQYSVHIHEELTFMKRLVKQVTDLLECRIDAVLKEMACTALCYLPDEPITIQEFLAQTEQTCNESCKTLTRQSGAVERAVQELVDTLKNSLQESELTNLYENYACMQPDSRNKKQRCMECLPCSYHAMLASFAQRNTDALIKCTRLSLDAIKRRMQTSTSKYTRTLSDKDEENKIPLFKSDIVLAIPTVVMRPSLDDAQQIMNKAVHVILRMAQNIPQWEQTLINQRSALKEIEEANKDEKEDSKVALLNMTQKPLYKVISEHKDVIKVVITLNSITSTFKTECIEVLESYARFSELWNEDPEEKVKQFMEAKPLLSEIEAQIRYYRNLQATVEELPGTRKVGAIVCVTDKLLDALTAEARAWKNAFGRALNAKASTDMMEIFDFIDNLQKRLSRPIQDLDDVRAAMDSLSIIRESEVRIDMTIGPIEESYALLNKFELHFNDGNAEKVDSLTYAWQKLVAQALQVQSHLLVIQPKFKANLLDGVAQYQEKVKEFYSDYDTSYPLFITRGELMLKGDATGETISLMEDSLMVLGSLMSNRYNAPFKPDIQKWVQKLSNTTEIIENWMQVQNLWVYLEAVFVGGDIAKQLPQEAKRFSNIDKSWVKIMQKAHENTNVVQCCVGDDTMNQLLPHLLEQLEICQKSLTGYLEKKRLVFPRFFFVSDPALLEILGQASDSHTIQAHLEGLFDNVKTVDFHEKNYDQILAIGSREKEKIDLDAPVNAQGNVEIWLGELLKTIRHSIHGIIRTAYIAIQDKENFKLIEFENTYAAQIGLLGIQMLWTRDSEEALKNARSDKKIMGTTNQYFLDILNTLIDVTTQDLTKYERTKFETLVTIHVHQRDIFDDLVRMHVKSINDFEWLKQSRFYFNDDTDQCLISVTDVDFSYMNEPVGCTDRLVITPLTDRCYITLAQALGMSMGGAPAGPAGTGKTETTKDMGKALGKYVVVFNCSDQMDFRGLGRIYKGLAQSGSWGCFDEFNRIELPVLSVAAQQIAIVLTCKKERKPTFIFTDGDVVSMDPEFAIFLTMNPGYAGRQELPENLKIQFRTVAMMVPDRQIIIRVKLASCGFQGNVLLARKFYTLYKLCEEQLTKQVHYDFGLRNILSVLRTLGAVKRSSPNDSESMIVMRVLRDMNLSKLVDEDEPLFLSLIDDLFPGMQLDKAGYPDIEAAIEKQVNDAGLVFHPPWVLKLIQLFETQRVRHGMMTLGPSGAGKTKCIGILMKAMGDCGSPHREMRMNPKAITAPQMFGRLDVATNDWTDGIFSTLWRKTLKAKKNESIWLVLDGPVDAIWIENLNSVLDDNKTLTLANGDRIPMSPNCKIIFEPHNIDNASPATVSRNGMVYMSSSIMDWNPIVQGWINSRPVAQQSVLFTLYEQNYKNILTYSKQYLNPRMDLLECMYTRQTIDLLDGLIPPEDSPNQPTAEHLERLFIFAVMWSVGALLELDDRKKLEGYMKSDCTLDLPKIDDSSQDTIFEYVVNDQGKWEHWSSRVPQYIYPSDSTPEYSSILVPNVDNIRTDFLINTIAKQEKGVLLIGEQGTAKTVMIKGYCNNYDPEQHLAKSVNFSSATTPNMFQRTVESYVDKRVGTTYGPPAGKKMTVFIDDINMPVINEWGDQITNEIVRQVMENKGFYNLEKPGDFTNIVDIQYIAAMIQPGGGRNDIPQRLKRQFNVFNSTLPSNQSIDKIFSTVGTGHYCKERGFCDEVIDLAEMLVSCTRRLWQSTKVKMLPTPAKFHYIFNLRDLSRIWQGMLNTISEVICNQSVLLALWRHECNRVIADRFTNQEDKNWFDAQLKKVAEADLGTALAEQIPAEPYFVDFLRDAPEITGDEPDDADLDAPKIYEPIENFQQLSERLIGFMAQYNETVRGGKMDLVFFKDAMVHLVKISRIIRTPRGNALLVGVGGSGKQSLTRLASFIAGYKSFQITLTRSYNVSNLMEDLKHLYRTAGQQGQGITFIFTDNEIKDEGFLEYMNNVLASGEVSNLFARDEIDEITGELIPVMKKEFPRRPPTNENLYEYFLSRVRSNLHVVLCFSPVGEKFRGRSLKFPGLISGCTMDWFSRWPKDALIAVSQHFLSNFEIVCTDTVKKSVVNTMGVFQDLVAESCIDYFQRFRRQTHVTPKSYLSFIDSFTQVYAEKREAIGILADRMQTGLAKLVEATHSVNELSKELAVKEKELAVASKKADAVLAEVTVSAQAAEKVKAQVQKVKDKAQVIVDEIEADKAVATEKLEAAKPALEEAEAALNTIKPSHISTVRKLAKPPHLIMRIMDCVLILFQRKMDPPSLDPEKPSMKPSWAEALKLLGGSNFLQGLLTFPKDTINEETVELLAAYMDSDDYNMESAKKSCGDVAGLCSWTKAMAFFYGINKQVLPLKANLVLQEARLGTAMVTLQEAQSQLDEKQKELDLVQAQYDSAISEKQALLDDAESCRRKMDNATALIEGLGGEKVRWTEASKQFEEQINRLVGDVLLATGFLSYSGPFNQEFRELLLKNWKKEMNINKIPYSDDLNISGMLTDAATIGEWNLQGLPNDELSIQNGIIVTKATRFPLLIDPQGQGKNWIRNREKENQLQVTALNHKYFRTHLEDSLSLGRPLMIEDVAEELDPALDNVLEKNFIKSGSTFKVKVGDKEVDVMKGFCLYITTKLANPAYTPEVSARTSIIDFTVTIKGLEDQLLGIVILTEKNELEAERVKLMEEVTANKRKMQELEDNLLYRLTSTKGSLVEDESLIEVLKVTKSTAEDVSEKLTIAAETEIRINTAREEFRPVATRGSILYFLIVEMSMVNVMYQTSLKQFLGIFDLSMARSNKSPITSKRIHNIIEYLTYEAFQYTARGLYENHKFLFTLLLALKIDLQGKKIKHEEFQTLIKGGAALDLNAVDPKPKKWISDMTWLNLVQLCKLPQFSQILGQIGRNDKGWKQWFDEDAPEEAVIPDGYSASLDVFRKLLLVRSWCPDRTIPQARHYIADSIGVKFAEGVILNMEEMRNESTKRVPLICFLSMGSDPTENIEKLAKKMGVKCSAISMGQGQEVHARRLISGFMQDGGWALLQNCHLGLDFMDELLDTVLNTESVHDGFRIWLTTEVHPKFPINLLQCSIKFTNEPPQGIKAGIKRTYAGITQEQLDISSMPQWRPILYAVAFLHTIVQERRKFGPLGWNIPYEFNQADFTASVQFVNNHLDDMDPKKGVSWNTVRYMLGEVQYGGRVTDDFDKRLLNTYARVWFSEDMFSDKFKFYKGYTIPKCRNVDEYRGAIENIPLVDTPEAFGLHPNADITYQTNMATEVLDTIVNIQPKDSAGGGGETREAAVYRLANEMLEKLPEDYKMFEVRGRLQKMGHLQPLNIFLRQEIDRMQRVISAVRITLSDLKLAIDGTIIMSENLRDALDNMYDARVPALWRKISWDSTTLGFWFTELIERNLQFSSWIFEGRPNVFWMTGFFNPQGFLTAMRQEITRAHKGWALDSVVLHNDMTRFSKEDISSPPNEGVYVHGLFLDGAGWDRRNCKLVEPQPKVLFTPLPVAHVYAINQVGGKDPRLYECPVYKKPQRTDLTYIFPLYLKTVQHPDHWILRGVALLCDTK